MSFPLLSESNQLQKQLIEEDKEKAQLSLVRAMNSFSQRINDSNHKVEDAARKAQTTSQLLKLSCYRQLPLPKGRSL